MVAVFDLLSHGRIYHRNLQYCTDARFAVKDMQEAVCARVQVVYCCVRKTRTTPSPPSTPFENL